MIGVLREMERGERESKDGVRKVRCLYIGAKEVENWREKRGRDLDFGKALGCWGRIEREEWTQLLLTCHVIL